MTRTAYFPQITAATAILCSMVVVPGLFVDMHTLSIYASAALCLLGVLYGGVVHRFAQDRVAITLSELLLFLWVVWLFGRAFADKSGCPENTWAVIASVFLYVMLRRRSFSVAWWSVVVVAWGVLQAVYGLAQYAGLAPVAASGFRMSGSFDNPAGYAAMLSAVFPSALFLAARKNGNPFVRICGGAAAALFVAGIVLSQSRAGLVSILVVSGVQCRLSGFCSRFLPKTGRLPVAASAVAGIMVAAGLYFHKKDSADGRILIAACTADMVAAAPLAGNGTGSFKRQYMLHQADYFRKNPESVYAVLADNTRHPFNEYLLLLAEHGLAGLLFLAAFFAVLRKNVRRDDAPKQTGLMLVLLSTGVFACFSYPFHYPVILLLWVVSAAGILHGERPLLHIRFPARLFRVLLVTGVLFALWGMADEVHAEYRWNAIAQKSLSGKTEAMMPHYQKLYPKMKRNALFLYNYGAELNHIGRHGESNLALAECLRYMNDAEIQLLIADNYARQKNCRKAEEHLLLAHYMVPVRFIPLYRLALLYEQTGQHEKARRMAEQIVDKPVKIPSATVSQIKREMAELIRKHTHQIKKINAD